MNARDQWEKFLSPEVTRDRLISASMFITTFELLKEAIVGRLRDFYSIGVDQDGAMVGTDYQRRVLSRNGSLVYASLDWLKELDAVDEVDLATFEGLKEVRNRLAHELPSIVMGAAELDLTSHFERAINLLRKIEVWWVVNVEIATDPEFDGKEVDEASIIPGRVLMLQLMLDVLNGNTEHLENYMKAAPQPGS